MNAQKLTNRVTRSHAPDAGSVERTGVFKAAGRNTDWTRKGNRKFRDYNDTPAWARSL